MQRHFEELSGEDEPDFRQVAWADIHRYCLSLNSRLKGLDAWLVQQLARYLEVIGMSDFSGFRQDFFDYFFAHDDEDTRKWVKQNMEAFARNIMDELRKSIPFYQHLDPGNLKQSDTFCWVAFGPKDSKHPEAYRKVAHQTISADSQGMEIFLNVELKPAVEKLREKIKNRHSDWRKLVSQLHNRAAFTLKIEERVKKQVQNFDYRSVCAVESACLCDPRLADYTFAYLESLLEKIPLPYVTLTTRVDRQEAIQESGTDYGRKLVERVTLLMAGFHPLVEFING